MQRQELLSRNGRRDEASEHSHAERHPILRLEHGGCQTRIPLHVDVKPRAAAGLLESCPAGGPCVRRFLRQMRAGSKTWNAKPGEIERRWFVVDAEGKTLGRLAVPIADTLRGKNKPAVHAPRGHGRLRDRRQRREDRTSPARSSTRRSTTATRAIPGGIRKRTLREQLERRPTEVLRKAVKGMLPRNRLGRAQITKLKIYAGPEHPHEAQTAAAAGGQ